MVVNGRDKDRVVSTEAAFRSEGLDVVGICGSMDTEPAVAALTTEPSRRSAEST